MREAKKSSMKKWLRQVGADTWGLGGCLGGCLGGVGWFLGGLRGCLGGLFRGFWGVIRGLL